MHPPLFIFLGCLLLSKKKVQKCKVFAAAFPSLLSSHHLLQDLKLQNTIYIIHCIHLKRCLVYFLSQNSILLETFQNPNLNFHKKLTEKAEKKKMKIKIKIKVIQLKILGTFVLENLILRPKMGLLSTM